MRFTSCEFSVSPLFLLLAAIPDRWLSPGGYLDPTEKDETGLICRLDEQLGVPLDIPGENTYDIPDDGDWEVKDCLCIWWRPNFDTFMVSRRGVCQLYCKEN